MPFLCSRRYQKFLYMKTLRKQEPLRWVLLNDDGSAFEGKTANVINLPIISRVYPKLRVSVFCEAIILFFFRFLRIRSTVLTFFNSIKLDYKKPPKIETKF